MNKLGARGGIERSQFDIVAKGSRIRTIGGLAVIKSYTESQYTFPWLVGMSVQDNGSSSYATHRLTPDQNCDTSSWCLGAVFSAGHKLIQATGMDVLSPYSRTLSIEDMLRTGDDPRFARNTEARELFGEFYAQGHTFDKEVFPVLHGAMKQIIRTI